jgi:probable blue pigment (indigoidine) exporter
VVADRRPRRSSRSWRRHRGDRSSALDGRGHGAFGTLGRPSNASKTATDQLFIGGLLLLPVALVLEGPMPAPDPSALLGWLLLVPLGTSLAFALWVRGAQRLGPSAAFLGLASPVVAVAIDVVWMGTWTSTSQWAGSALVLGSTAVGIGRPLPRTNRP